MKRGATWEGQFGLVSFIGTLADSQSTMHSSDAVITSCVGSKEAHDRLRQKVF